MTSFASWANTKPDLSARQYRILVVDDDDTIREGLVGYLQHYHEADYGLTVDACVSPADAKAKLTEQAYHLVISDINLPDEDGFSLLQFVKTQYPNTQIALITAYNVEDYVKNAKSTGIFNIIAKTAPFDFEELSLVVNNLLEPTEAFGLSTYMDPLCQLSEIIIRSSDDIMVAFQQLQNFLALLPIHNPNDLITAMIEAITNAVYHVAKREDGSLKYTKGQPIEQLAPEEYVYIYYGRDLNKVGISIVDQGGRITAEEILYWLERNISGSGLLDTHGRGVYLIHRLVDRVLVNIAPGQRTEIIILDYLNQQAVHNKPIYINQLR